LSAYKSMVVNLAMGAEPERLLGYRASLDFFQTLAARFAMGRGFSLEQEQAGGDRVVVLSYGLWQRDFGGWPNALGEAIDLDGRAYRVIGVLSPNFEWPMAAELWVPLVLNSSEKHDRQNRSFYVVGRLRPTVSLTTAQEEMNLLSRDLARQYPLSNENRAVELVRLPGQFNDTVIRAFLFVLMTAVGFVLLLACSNLTNLILADTMARQREIAVRSVLGASRARVILQALAENAMLSSRPAPLYPRLVANAAKLARCQLRHSSRSRYRIVLRPRPRAAEFPLELEGCSERRRMGRHRFTI
jgi:putative ABC transport system permease protein